MIHADEVKWCRALFGALVDLQAEPSLKVGDFYDKAMAIEGVEARLAFVNRGQGWVVRKLRALVPRVRDTALHGVLGRDAAGARGEHRQREQALARRAAPADAVAALGERQVHEGIDVGVVERRPVAGAAPFQIVPLQGWAWPRSRARLKGSA